MRSLRVAILFLFMSLLLSCAGHAEKQYDSISAEKAKEVIQLNNESDNFIILDVRTQKEFDSAHIKNARLLDFYRKDFKKQIISYNSKGLQQAMKMEWDVECVFWWR